MTYKTHGATEEVNYEQLTSLYVPEQTRTHVPIPHHKLWDILEEKLSYMGHETRATEFLVSKDGQKFVGKFKLHGEDNASGEDGSEYAYQGAIFNSHDKTLPVAVTEGTHTFVCSNGLYIANFVVSNKHTKNIWDTVHKELKNFVWDLANRRNKMFNWIEQTRNFDYSSDKEVHDCLIREMKAGIINPTDIKPILEHWENPEHEEFKDRNGYSLVNAHTSHWRAHNPFTLPSKSIKLRRFINDYQNNSGTDRNGHEETGAIQIRTPDFA